jgi:hypothetical protein
MARKLKVYRTTAGGFFELAVAAPSMKAAAEAWGADPDVFKRGFAEETDDPKAVEATMAAPGTVVRRPVGSDGEFSEHAALPKAPEDKRGKPNVKPGEVKRKTGANADQEAKQTQKAVQKASQAAALEKERKEQAAALERERQRQAREEKRKEAERERARKEHDQMIAKADAELEKARARHNDAIEALSQRREELERRGEALVKDEAREKERWEAEQRRHEDALKESASDRTPSGRR